MPGNYLLVLEFRRNNEDALKLPEDAGSLSASIKVSSCGACLTRMRYLVHYYGLFSSCSERFEFPVGAGLSQGCLLWTEFLDMVTCEVSLLWNQGAEPIPATIGGDAGYTLDRLPIQPRQTTIHTPTHTIVITDSSVNLTPLTAYL